MNSLARSAPDVLAERLRGFLAPCEPFLRFGIPGAAVERWLAATEYSAIRAFATDLDVIEGSAWTNLFRYPLRGSRELFMRACLGGRIPACESVALGVVAQYAPHPALPAHGWIGERAFSRGVHDVFATTTLRAVERDLGAPALAEVWRTDAPIAETIARLRGRPLGEWMHQRISEELNRAGAARTSRMAIDIGPLPRSGQWLTALLAIAGGVAVAVAGVRAREHFA